MRKAFIALGANLGEPARQVEAAFAALERQPGIRLLARSRLYRSAPIGVPGQPDYCNTACVIETALPARALLAVLQSIETALGRRREGVHWGPRMIDLDLLHVEGERSDTPELRLPHPHLQERNFVLVPLAEVAPGLEIEGVGRVDELAARAGRHGLTLWGG